MKRKYAVVKRVWDTKSFTVQIMARDGRWLMVRRKGARPFVVNEIDVICKAEGY